MSHPIHQNLEAKQGDFFQLSFGMELPLAGATAELRVVRMGTTYLLFNLTQDDGLELIDDARGRWVMATVDSDATAEWQAGLFEYELDVTYGSGLNFTEYYGTFEVEANI